MDRRQIFDTTVYDEATDTAFGVMSFPFIGGDTPSLLQLLGELELRPIAEIDPRKLGDAISAVLATRDVTETMEWLLEPPDPVGLLYPYDVPVAVTDAGDVSRLRKRRLLPPAARAVASARPPRIIVKQSGFRRTMPKQ